MLEIVQTTNIIVLSGSRPGQADPPGAADGTLCPLVMEPGFFTGKKPRFLILEDGTRQEVGTWTGVAAAVLTYYNRDPARHRALMALRGRVRGSDGSSWAAAARECAAPPGSAGTCFWRRTAAPRS